MVMAKMNRAKRCGSIKDNEGESGINITKDRARKFWELYKSSTSGNPRDAIAFDEFISDTIPIEPDRKNWNWECH
jgi:hypothetical protein